MADDLVFPHALSDNPQLAGDVLISALSEMQIRAWRLRIDAGRSAVAVHDLRTAWWSALSEISVPHYDAVAGNGLGGRPRYVLRSVAGERAAVDFILLGTSDDVTNSVIWQAWERAGCVGAGRHRRVFFLDGIAPLSSDGRANGSGRRQEGFPLFPLAWPLPCDHPCRLHFPRLRLMRDGRLLAAPGLADLATAGLRRIQLLTGYDLRAARPGWLDAAEQVVCGPWEGARRDYSYDSEVQQRRISMSAVVGGLHLPEGPRALTPLLAALQWLHVGQGTTLGMGHLLVQPC